MSIDLSFNLVIEVLVVSRVPMNPCFGMVTSKFQSRNRGSCRFKTSVANWATPPRTCFNLVIEVLVVSSTNDAAHDAANEVKVSIS